MTEEEEKRVFKNGDGGDDIRDAINGKFKEHSDLLSQRDILRGTWVTYQNTGAYLDIPGDGSGVQVQCDAAQTLKAPDSLVGNIWNPVNHELDLSGFEVGDILQISTPASVETALADTRVELFALHSGTVLVPMFSDEWSAAGERNHLKCDCMLPIYDSSMQSSKLKLHAMSDKPAKFKITELRVTIFRRGLIEADDV